MKTTMIFRTFALFTCLASALQASAPPGRYTDELGAPLTGGSVQVKDTVTRLIWQRGYVSFKTWSASLAAGSAQLYCSQLSIGSNGAGSWRLPTFKELSTLVDVVTTTFPSIDTTAFPGSQGSIYWSSTAYQPSLGNAWQVDLGTGGVSYSGISSWNCARCVR